MTTEMKKESFCNEYKKDCEIIPIHIATLFSNYAKKRDVNFDIIYYINDIFINKDKHASNTETETEITHKKELWNNK